MTKLPYLHVVLLVLLCLMPRAHSQVNWPAALGTPEGPNPSSKTTRNTQGSTTNTAVVPLAVSKKHSTLSRSGIHGDWPSIPSKPSRVTVTTQTTYSAASTSNGKEFADGQHGRCMFDETNQVFHCNYLAPNAGYYCDQSTLMCQRSRRIHLIALLLICAGIGMVVLAAALIAWICPGCQSRKPQETNLQGEPANQHIGEAAGHTDAGMELPDQRFRRAPTLPPIPSTTTLNGSDIANNSRVFSGPVASIVRPSGVPTNQVPIEEEVWAADSSSTGIPTSRAPSYEAGDAQPLVCGTAVVTQVSELASLGADGSRSKSREDEAKEDRVQTKSDSESGA